MSDSASRNSSKKPLRAMDTGHAPEAKFAATAKARDQVALRVEDGGRHLHAPKESLTKERQKALNALQSSSAGSDHPSGGSTFSTAARTAASLVVCPLRAHSA